MAAGPADKEYLLSIMNPPIYETGRFANYIAPPARGIKGKPVNFEYVRTEARRRGHGEELEATEKN